MSDPVAQPVPLRVEPAGTARAVCVVTRDVEGTSTDIRTRRGHQCRGRWLPSRPGLRAAVATADVRLQTRGRGCVGARHAADRSLMIGIRGLGAAGRAGRGDRDAAGGVEATDGEGRHPVDLCQRQLRAMAVRLPEDGRALHICAIARTGPVATAAAAGDRLLRAQAEAFGFLRRSTPC